MTPARPVRTARLVACHSILQLDAQHPLAQRAVLDPHIMHRTVMAGFHGWVEPEADDARAQMGVLNVWDLDLRTDRLVLVVQSRVQPDWSSIPSSALVEDIVTFSVDMPIRRGDTFTFRTVINPSRERQTRRDTPAGRQPVRQRLSDTTPAYVRDWFGHRLDPAEPGGTPARPEIRRIGASGETSAMAVRMLPKLSLHARHQGARIGRAEVRGVLTVTEPHVFAQALAQGIGRARAYGCGLLLVRQQESGPSPAGGVEDAGHARA